MQGERTLTEIIQYTHFPSSSAYADISSPIDLDMSELEFALIFAILAIN